MRRHSPGPPPSSRRSPGQHHKHSASDRVGSMNTAALRSAGRGTRDRSRGSARPEAIASCAARGNPSPHEGRTNTSQARINSASSFLTKVQFHPARFPIRRCRAHPREVRGTAGRAAPTTTSPPSSTPDDSTKKARPCGPGGRLNRSASERISGALSQDGTGRCRHRSAGRPRAV